MGIAQILFQSSVLDSIRKHSNEPLVPTYKSTPSTDTQPAPKMLREYTKEELALQKKIDGNSEIQTINAKKNRI